MPRSKSEVLSHAQVARIESRRKAIRLTSADLLERFAGALKAAGCVHSGGSAKMRLDRVLNPKMRRPVSEGTKAALAHALDWDLEEFEKAVCGKRGRQLPTSPSKSKTCQLTELQRELGRVATALRSQAGALNSLARRLSRNGQRV